MPSASTAKPWAKPRLAHIETIRGLACLLLVAYHVVGNVPEKGLRLPDDHVLAILNGILDTVRMPLFSFISGYVLRAFIADAAALRDNIEKKARRLLLPLVFVGALHYAMQTAVYGGNPVPVWAVYLLPYEHFWFLQATFLLMVFVFAMSWLAGPDFRRTVLLLFGFALAIFVMDIQPGHDIFAFSRAFYLAPFFLLGLIGRIHRLDERLNDVPRARLAIALLCFAIVLPVLAVQLAWPEPRLREAFGRQTPLGLIVALAACAGLFCLRWESRLLAWIGPRSYTIFLFHVFFTAGARIVATRLLGPVSEWVLFPLGLATGILGPIVLDRLILLSPWASLAFLGIQQRRPPVLAEQPSRS
jgi:peptidoglycan/LPS O-acetylase OafA/YrhL